MSDQSDILFVLPTDEAAQAFARERIQPDMVEVPVALHPRFRSIRNKRKRWRAIRAIKRTGVTCYLDRG